MQDDFHDFAPSLSDPPSRGETLMPSDTDNQAFITRALYVGGGGDVRLRLASGDEIILAMAQGGALYPLRVAQVLATGTTATDLIGLR